MPAESKGTHTGQRPPLVGRDLELGRLERALATASTGRATVLLISGEAGIGKSTLISAALADHPADVILLEARCDEGELELEYGVVDQLVADAPVPSSNLTGAATEPFHVGAGLLGLIGKAQDPDITVVMVVDDAQWADPASLQALTFTARRLRADRVLLCLLSRPDGVRRLPPGIRRRIEETGGTIALDGLDRDAVMTLASEGYGVDLRPGAGERLRSHTGGNPLHLRLVLDNLAGTVLNRDDPLPVPTSYASLVSGQVASCSPTARELLTALAVLGQEFGLSDTAAVAGVATALEAADELVGHGLVDVAVDETGTRLAFRHALVRASVLDGIPLPHRARLHGAAADVLTGHDALRHRLAAAAEPSPALVDAARAEADALVARGTLTPAARLLSGAARLLRPGKEREELILAAAVLLLDAGAPVEALVPEIQRYDAGPARDFVLGRLSFHGGDPTAATQLLTRAWSAVPEGSTLAARVADMLAVVSTATGRFDELAVWSRRAVADGNGSVNSATMLFYGVSLDSSLPDAERELAALVTAGRDDEVRLGARLALGMCLLAQNELDRAETELSAACIAPQVQGSIQAFVNARAFLAECHFRRGNWRRAHDLAVSTASIVDDAGAQWMSALAHTVAATVLAGLGDLDAARTHASEARSTAEELGMVQGMLWAQVASMRIAEAAGDHEQVVQIGDALLEAGTAGLPDWVQRRRPTYIEALVAVDRVADAVPQLRALDSEAAATGDTSLAAEAARVRAAYLAATGDRSGALDAFAHGLRLDETRSRPFERARLELASGAHHRRDGERRAAAVLLTSAAARFRALGARPWLERCERELAACGLQPVKRSRQDAGQGLTPQEHLVANLVAAGMTNRQIAAELVLSAKTVEFHLSRIYRKRGVSSRSQLTAQLTATGARDN